MLQSHGCVFPNAHERNGQDPATNHNRLLKKPTLSVGIAQTSIKDHAPAQLLLVALHKNVGEDKVSV